MNTFWKETFENFRISENPLHASKMFQHLIVVKYTAYHKDKKATANCQKF